MKSPKTHHKSPRSFLLLLVCALISWLSFVPNTTQAQACACNFYDDIGYLPSDMICYQYARAYFRKFGNLNAGAWVPSSQEYHLIYAESASSTFSQAEGYYLVDCPDEASMVHYGGHVAVVLPDAGCMVSKQDGSSTVDLHGITHAGGTGTSTSTKYYKYQQKNIGLDMNCFPSDFCDGSVDPPCNPNLTGMVHSGSYSGSLSSYQSVPSYYTTVQMTQGGITWSKIGGNGTYSTSNNGQNANIYLNSGNGLYLKLQNDCATRFVFFVRSSGPQYRLQPTDDPHTPPISLSPNPFRDILEVRLKPEKEGQNLMHLRIVSSNGAIMMERWLNTSYTLPLSYLSPGLYIVQLTDHQNNPIYMEKVLKIE